MGKYLQMLATLKISQVARQVPDKTDLSSQKISQVPILRTDKTDLSLLSVLSVPYMRPRKIFEIIKASETLQLLELMPDDLRWLENQLYWKSDAEKVHLLDQYQQVWQQAMTNEPQAIMRQQSGRVAANRWISQQLTANNDQ